MKLTVQSMGGSTVRGLENATVTMHNTKNGQFRTQSLRNRSTTKKKALNYNAREISSQLMRANKSRNATNVLSKAKSKVAMLQRCKGSGQYNDSEVEIALSHAKRMVKCAQLKVGNLKQEESLRKSRERELTSDRQQQKNEVKRRVAQKERELKQKVEMQELQQSMKEKECRRDLMRKRRMHRNQERSEMIEAEMEYLKRQSGAGMGTQTVGAGVTLDLSSAAISMNELQMLEAELQMEVEMEMELSGTETVEGVGDAVSSLSSGSIDAISGGVTDVQGNGGAVNVCI